MRSRRWPPSPRCRPTTSKRSCSRASSGAKMSAATPSSDSIRAAASDSIATRPIPAPCSTKSCGRCACMERRSCRPSSAAPSDSSDTAWLAGASASRIHIRTIPGFRTRAFSSSTTSWSSITCVSASMSWPICSPLIRMRRSPRPTAGTLPRGKTAEEDRKLEVALLADPKENAEHLMLVDLGRNDLGRVCRSGSVEVTKFRYIERYSHVMHLVTDVRGRLRPDRTPVNLFLSCFPAGTLTGAPKIRAMELIDRFETTRRGPYGGAVGYFGFSGNLDSCITIRTIVLARDRAYLQAGAGIVYDSDPAYEYDECVSKSAALRQAISLAKAVLQQPRN